MSRMFPAAAIKVMLKNVKLFLTQKSLKKVRLSYYSVISFKCVARWTIISSRNAVMKPIPKRSSGLILLLHFLGPEIEFRIIPSSKLFNFLYLWLAVLNKSLLTRVLSRCWS